MSIQATWNNFIPGTRVRCIYQYGRRTFETGVVQSAKKHGTDMEGDIVIRWDSDGELGEEWSCLDSFEIVGPTCTWNNLVEGTKIRRTSVDTGFGPKLGDIVSVTHANKTAASFEVNDAGVLWTGNQPEKFELVLKPCNWEDVKLGAKVCCIIRSSIVYGRVGTIAEVDNGENYLLDYQSGNSYNWIDPSRIALVGPVLPSSPLELANKNIEQAAQVSKPAPIAQTKGIDWDAYNGVKRTSIPTAGRIILDPRGGILRIKS